MGGAPQLLESLARITCCSADGWKDVLLSCLSVCPSGDERARRQLKKPRALRVSMYGQATRHDVQKFTRQGLRARSPLLPPLAGHDPAEQLVASKLDRLGLIVIRV